MLVARRLLRGAFEQPDFNSSITAGNETGNSSCEIECLTGSRRVQSEVCDVAEIVHFCSDSASKQLERIIFLFYRGHTNSNWIF